MGLQASVKGSIPAGSKYPFVLFSAPPSGAPDYAAEVRQNQLRCLKLSDCASKIKLFHQYLSLPLLKRIHCAISNSYNLSPAFQVCIVEQYPSLHHWFTEHHYS